MENNWKEEIIASAISVDMCDPYLSALNKQTNKLSALRLYKAGVDWALEHNCPAADFLRNNYTRFELEHAGIYMDREFCGETINDHIFQVFHNCTGSIRVELNMDKIIIPTLYLASGSDLNVSIASDIDIGVYLFDKAKITATGKYIIRRVIKDRNVEDADFKPNINQPDL